MQVGILGPLSVRSHGRTIEIGGSRLRMLLVRLALDAGRTVSVDALADALWPDAGPVDPSNALQSLVSRLRRALPEESLRSTAGGYCLDVDPDDVDAQRFERLAREGRDAVRRAEHRLAAERLRAALDLWRGEALSDASDAPFALAPRARMAELRLAAVEDRIEAEIGLAAEPAPLVAELEELTAAHPLRERARGLLMRALLADGRQAEALTAFEQYRQLLAETIGADPGAQLREIHVNALRTEPLADRPDPARSRGNLRAPLTSFVGRTDERARLRARLSEGRLVTLVGPGGVGKTRLATTVAAELGADLPGGAWLVDLAPVTDPTAIGQAVVNALGLRERALIEAAAPPASAMDRLVDGLSAETLIVLDNCEHLIDAAAQFSDELLGRCPLVRMVATSREPLGVNGEALCAVPPLRLPPAEGAGREAMAAPAVRLFADRVRAVQPDFAITDQNLPMVMEVCRRLDGLPLAIELAAARLRSMTVESLAARLDDRFRLLAGGSRAAVPRHRTLRAVVAWSWDLLDDDERDLLRWLAVFPATITAESAAQAPLLTQPAAEVMDTLSALVDKSLLQIVDDTQPTYRMLETIREYVLEALTEAGDITAARVRHSAYFLGLAESAEPNVRGPDQLPYLARLAREQANFVTALRFMADTGRAETAVRLAGSLAVPWAIQGRHAEAIDWLHRALDLPGPVPDGIRRTATAGYLLNMILSGGYMDSQAKQESARRAAASAGARTGDGHPVGVLLEPALGLIANDTSHGLATIDQRLDHPDPWTRGMLRLMRAFLQSNHGDLDGARRDLAAGVAEFRSLGDRWGLALALTWVANAGTMLGDRSGAAQALAESIGLLRELDPGDDAVLQRVWLAMIWTQQGDRARARAELVKTVNGGVGTPSTRYLVFAQLSLGDLDRYDGDLAGAEAWYDAVWRELDRVPFYAPPFRALVECSRAHAALSRDDRTEARRHLREALALAIDSTDMPVVAMIGVGIAALRWRDGDATAAARTLGAAHLLRGAPDEYHPDVLSLSTRLREALGTGAFQAEYARGQGLDRPGALALLAPV